MRRWPDLTIAAAMLIAAVPASADDKPQLSAAAQASIVAGAQACVGATLEPDPDPARFTGWAPVSPEQRKELGSEGKVVTRDNVMIAYQPGKDGGCVVLAKGDAGFNPATFYPQLGMVIGATVAANEKPAPVDLPDGELIIPVITPKTAAAVGTPDVILVFANRAGKHAKKGN